MMMMAFMGETQVPTTLADTLSQHRFLAGPTLRGNPAAKRLPAAARSVCQQCQEPGSVFFLFCQTAGEPPKLVSIITERQRGGQWRHGSWWKDQGRAGGGRGKPAIVRNKKRNERNGRRDHKKTCLGFLSSG